MELELILEGGPTAGEVRRVAGQRLTIGRAGDNDWVLPDPEHALSKRHCTVERDDGTWWVTDTSTNGVFLDDAGQPLGRGQRAALRDGMRLGLGDYVLRVRLLPARAAPSSTRAAPPPTGSMPTRPPGSDLFDRSWLEGRPPLAPAHPVRVPPSPPVTRNDHAPPDEQALDLPRRTAPWPDEAEAEAAMPAAMPGLPPGPAPEELRPPAEPRPAGAAAADGRRLLAAFLEGAGLPPQEAPAADPEAELRALGQRFRAMAEGLFQLLALRAEIKRQTGLDRTLIAAQDNNPLKLTASADEAVLWLVRPRGAGYLEPKAAIEAAVADLKAFQPELLAAMQAALRQLLRRFDPAALEQALADTPLLALIAAGGRKAKRWELFKERYAEIARRAESEFLRAVGLDLRDGAHDPWRDR